MLKHIFIVLFFISSVSIFPQFYYPVTHHIITDDNGNGGQPASMIPLIMQELNKAFAPARIQFYMSCVGIDTIYNFTKKTYFCVLFILSSAIDCYF